MLFIIALALFGLAGWIVALCKHLDMVTAQESAEHHRAWAAAYRQRWIESLPEDARPFAESQDQ